MNYKKLIKLFLKFNFNDDAQALSDVLNSRYYQYSDSIGGKSLFHDMEVYKHDDMFYYKEFVNNLIENKDYSLALANIDQIDDKYVKAELILKSIEIGVKNDTGFNSGTFYEKLLEFVDDPPLTNGVFIALQRSINAFLYNSHVDEALPLLKKYIDYSNRLTDKNLLFMCLY